MQPLAGQHCFISGGSRGIGLAIARLFAAKGAGCTLIGRNEQTLVTAMGSLYRQDRSEQQHFTAPFDVSKQDGWEKLLSDSKARSCDILVNAAGVSQNSLLCKTSTADLTEIIDTNLVGTILGCRQVIPKMMKQRKGCIINVASLLATHGGRGASVYAASKAGVVGLTRSLAWEVGRFGIRANVLLPGYIQTDMTRALSNHKELSALIPLGRLGLVEDVANAALFLAQNSYAHNCVLNIDGGLSAT
ncbi:NAD(P)-binding protein [Daldinia sp. FL1419]|nr:NAD(P)-binding protein [Daldinia sp. FL1419]